MSSTRRRIDFLPPVNRATTKSDWTRKNLVPNVAHQDTATRTAHAARRGAYLQRHFVDRLADRRCGEKGLERHEHVAREGAGQIKERVWNLHVPFPRPPTVRPSGWAVEGDEGVRGERPARTEARSMMPQKPRWRIMR